MTNSPHRSNCQMKGCKKPLGPTEYQCKCMKYLCPIHWHAEVHCCTFDYQAEAKNNLLKTMSTPIVGSKVDKI
jgi:hypothetical protein